MLPTPGDATRSSPVMVQQLINGAQPVRKASKASSKQVWTMIVCVAEIKTSWLASTMV